MMNFDKHIKEALENLTQPYVPDDWLTMNELFAQTSFDQHINQKITLHEEIITTEERTLFDNFLNNKALDTFVQGKFELIEAAEMASDWDDFEPKLDNHVFDTQIFDKIAEHETKIPATDWAVFEQRLDEKAFDTQVKAKIEAGTAAYRSRDWWAMRRLLDRMNPQGNFIWEKAKRLLPFLLLLFVVAGGTSYWFGKGDFFPTEKTTFAHKPVVSVTKEPVFAENKNTQAAQKPILTQKNEGFIKQNKADISPKGAEMPIILPEIAENSPKIAEFPKQENKQETSLPISENKPFISPTPEMKKESAIPSNSPKIVIQKAHNQAIHLKNNAHTQAENKYQIKEIAFDNWNPKISIGAYTAMLGSVVELNDTLQIGTSLGLRTELSFNQKWSLTTDVLYSKRNFQTQYYKLYRPTNAYLQHLLIGNITSIDIPIMLKRTWNLNKKGNFNLYMQAGAVPTISLNEDYTHYDPTTIENVSKNWDANLREMAPVKQSFHFKPYMGNVIVAPGVQYHIGKLCLQAEPRFQWAIQPVSIENKTVHSVGFGISAVYQLAGKSQE